MPTTKRLADLFRAIATEDFARAGDIAAAICREEDKKGHRAAARTMRGALHPSSLNGVHGANGHPSPTTFPAAALARLSSDVSLDDVVLSPTSRRQLKEVVTEWRHRDKLVRKGIPCRSKLLFHGPPGCGKSLAARALGRELGLPVFVVRFDAVIGAYLGQTAIHLRQLFQYAEQQSCVLLLDELDALGKRRGSPLDVGELDRIVIALMQELEHSKPRGLIIGTSNLPKHLDHALWRRFDLALEFRAPSRSALATYATRLSKAMRIELPQSARREALRMPSFAAAESVVLAEARRQALRQA